MAMSQRFVDAMERFATAEGVDLITFEKGQLKDDVAKTYLATTREEGVLFIGQGAGESVGLSHREAPRRRRRLSVDHPVDRDGQSSVRR
jgi:hypothetical protein